jgi:chemotaxis protein CheD
MKNKLPRHMLVQEQIFIPDEPMEVVTMLGTSVAVCLYDIENARGGITHFSLPIWNGIGFKSAKYGNIAIEKLINQFLNPKNSELKIDKTKIIAKITGGSSVKSKSLVSYQNNKNEETVGHRNVSVAFSILKKHNIQISGSDIGGHVVRHISFNTLTGTVSVKHNFKS